jgi:autoinducer 2 (AI-2) kinase
MSVEYLMGLDAGGGGGTCLLVELESGRVETAFRPWTHQTVPGTGGWGFEMDLARCWSLIVQAARETMERASATPDQVLAVAATSMRHTTVVIDADGYTILAAPNRDGRAAAEGMALSAEHGAEFHQRTGHWPSPIFTAARLRWLAANAPDDLARASAFLSLSDWVAYRLCGQVATDLSQAGETLLFDLETQDWAWDLVEQLALPRALLPPIFQAGTRLGELGDQAAEALGLKAGIPVAVGGADTQCGLVGTGSISPGHIAAVAGTTTPVQLVVDRPLIDPQARLWTGHHVVPDLWVLESNAGSTGEALEWFAGALYPEVAPDISGALAYLGAEASKSPPGAAGILSTVGAAVMNASAMALPIGNLTLTHLAAARDPTKRRHLARAILEGMAYALRANAQQIFSVAGGTWSELWLAGGMSRSSLWTQIVSDVLNVPVSVPTTPEASALGAAICAGVGAGLFRDLEAGTQALARSARMHTPDPQRARTYQGLYAGWEQLREARAEADALAAGLALQALMGEPTPSPPPAGPAFLPRILVTADLDETSLEALRELGHVEYASYREVMRMLTGPDLVEELAGYHVFVTEVDVVDADALKQLPDLRAIVACRGNVVNVDVNACTALSIPVMHTPGRNAEAVADLTVAFLLMLGRKLPEAITFLYEPGSEAGDMALMGQAHRSLQGHELWGKTVGLVGFGAVGRAVARRLRPFGARILAYDPFVSQEDGILAGAEVVPLETVLQESDFVSLHAAVTEESRGLIGSAELARIKPGAFLINTARAALVDEDALVASLRSGHLGGAALDVFAIEPPGADHPLLSMPNVIATPHTGGNTFEVAAHQGRIVTDELKRLMEGERPLYVRNPETLDKFRWQGPREPLSPEAVAELSAAPGPAVSDLERDRTPRPAPESVPEAVQVRLSAPPHPLAEEPGEAEEKGLVSRGLSRLRGLRERLGRKPAEGLPAGAATGGPSGAQMERLLRAFVARMADDPALQAFASDQRLTIHYVLRDLELELYTSFQDGTVTGNLGEPPTPADVRLKMKAEVFDGMFTGQINATRAAMTGKLSFSGDTRLAMGMQRIQNDLGRLYNLARDEVGGPGNLTAVEEAPPAAMPAPPSAPPAPSQTAQLRGPLVQVVGELYTAGLITATGGNVSARIPSTEQILITPSQLFKGDLRPEVMVHIDMDGQALDPDALSPSSEWPMHCAVYQARPDVEAVIHAHAPQATILGLSGLPFVPISTEAAFLSDLARVPFIMPGTKDLAQAVVEALGEGAGVLLQNHGLLVAASSLRRAADIAEIIERTAEVILGCYAVGQEPPPLPEDVVAMLQEMGRLMA